MDLIADGLSVKIELDSPEEHARAVSEKLGVTPGDIKIIKILSKTLDIRDKEQFYYGITLAVRVPDSYDNKLNLPCYREKPVLPKSRAELKDRPVIIGFGPAGMFAALEFLEHGVKPIIFERGKMIERRNLDVAAFSRDRVFNTESNITFGEGGAGAYSDGKLFSRGHGNNAYSAKVLDTFVRFGAPKDLVYVEKPHLGTDAICGIIKNIRQYIIENGGEIRFDSKMTGLLVENGATAGVEINNFEKYRSGLVLPAIGHSADDTFRVLHAAGLELEQKPVSVGVRVEHPAKLINLFRYGEKYKDSGQIGSATYSLTYTNRRLGRGVYTFCMCPGGEVVNASSENGHLVINGMSYTARDSDFSNSAIVVTCHASDFGPGGVFAGLEFQREIERKAFSAGGGGWKAPAQNLMDYIHGRGAGALNPNSCETGTTSVELAGIFPEFVNKSLLMAFNKWAQEYPQFISESAVLLAPETRTSCALRMLRKENYESSMIKGLYPVGEGSGYAGGITSSAVDAIKAVESVLRFA
ncbi:MAG TPA: dehydrogenase [Elusimicrobia bacterium]|nr:MAG: dehydrogenase [Elusimicrobia bacterium RIFOXYA1_FULL_47_7]OGS15726.1 MAG: dehydrogenase [Elusimicrobia bacterium RIFOXYA2_FULL_47_53]OGS31027.1 MAG: dehydrogenase [Elusimicrobia bacterium RIFOXYB2_FULL_46_23]HBU70489.1 dehydrogenase [Elusimicrobiota bacterium]